MVWIMKSRQRGVWINTNPSLQHAHRQTEVAREYLSIDWFQEGSAGLIRVRMVSHGLKGKAGASTMARLG